MSALPIEPALRLYKLLAPFLPRHPEKMAAGEFIAQIVYNIKQSNHHRVYLEALAMMQNTTIDTILETYTPSESVVEFTRGLQENQILALQDFCAKTGI